MCISYYNVGNSIFLLHILRLHLVVTLFFLISCWNIQLSTKLFIPLPSFYCFYFPENNVSWQCEILELTYKSIQQRPKFNQSIFHSSGTKNKHKTSDLQGGMNNLLLTVYISLAIMIGLIVVAIYIAPFPMVTKRFEMPYVSHC